MSLTQSMTIQDREGNRISIVDFFNESGIATELYSNQPEGGQFDTALGYLFNNTKKKYYAIKFGQYVKHDNIVVEKAIESIRNNKTPTAILSICKARMLTFMINIQRNFLFFLPTIS